MTEDERRELREYIRRLDELISWVGREKLPHALRTDQMDRLLMMTREAREARDEGDEGGRT
jgi:hypothetical protein